MAGLSLLRLWSRLKGGGEFAESSYGMMKQISAPHARVHEGVFFHAAEIINPVATGGRLSYLIQVGSYDAHLRAYNFTATVGPAPVELYEAPFSDANSLGTPVTPRNLNRGSGTVSTVAINRDPFVNVSSLGILLDINLIEETAGGPIKAVGGESGAPVVEWELAKETNYLLSYVNSNGGNAIVASKIGYYEEGR